MKFRLEIIYTVASLFSISAFALGQQVFLPQAISIMRQNEMAASDGEVVYQYSQKLGSGFQTQELADSIPIQSIDETDMKFNGPSELLLTHSTDVDTANPKKLADTIIEIKPGGGFDGSFLTDNGRSSLGARVVGVETPRGHRPGTVTPLDFGLSTYGEPMSQFYSEGSFRVTGEENVRGIGRVLKVQGRTSDGITCTASIALDEGGLTIERTLDFRPKGDALAFVTSRTKKFGAAWVPMDGQFTVTAAGANVPRSNQTVTTNSFTLGNVSASEVGWKLATGSSMTEAVTGRHYHVGASGDKEYFEFAGEKQAEQNRSMGWMLIGSIVALGLALFGWIRTRVKSRI